MEEPGNAVVGGQWEPWEEGRAATTRNLGIGWGPARQDVSLFFVYLIYFLKFYIQVS